MTDAQRVRRSADYILSAGLRKGESLDDGIDIVANGDPADVFDALFGHGLTTSHTQALSAFAARYFGIEDVFFRLDEWNDEKETTAEDVAALLRAWADELEK